jgi:hypothetical protein
LDSVTRLHDSGSLGQAATRLAFAQPFGNERTASSVATTATGIRLSNWTFTTAGAVSLASTETQSHAVSQLDAANLTGTLVVTGYRDASTGNLHVLMFNSGHTVNIGRGAIDDNRLAVVRNSFDLNWFVAFITTSGDLEVEFWDFGPGPNPHPTFVGATRAGAASHIAGSFSSSGLVTAVRTGGNLKLIRWDVGPHNAPRRRGDSGGQGGSVQDLRVAAFSSFDSVAGQFVVSAAKNSAGNLELISWRLELDGSLTKVDTFVSGAVGELAITTFQVPGDNLGVFVTAVTDASGDLQVTAWRVRTDGSIHHVATATAGAASHIAIMDVDTEMVATTCLTSSGVEKVITWRVTVAPLLPP